MLNSRSCWFNLVNCALLFVAFFVTLVTASSYDPWNVRVIVDKKPDGAEVTKTIYSSLYLVIIAIDSYPDATGESTGYATSDARAVKAALVGNYNFFRITEIYNQAATRTRIVDQLLKRELMATEKNDGVIIFFAGKGLNKFVDSVEERGYLVPYDGDNQNVSSNISFVELKEIYNKIPAKHILLVFDGCVNNLASVSDVPGRKPSKSLYYLQAIVDEPARQFIFAGNKNQQMIVNSETGLSLFAEELIAVITEEGEHFLTSNMLGRSMRTNIIQISAEIGMDLSPRYGYFSGRGDTILMPDVKTRLEALRRTLNEARLSSNELAGRLNFEQNHQKQEELRYQQADIQYKIGTYRELVRKLARKMRSLRGRGGLNTLLVAGDDQDTNATSTNQVLVRDFTSYENGRWQQNNEGPDLAGEAIFQITKIRAMIQELDSGYNEALDQQLALVRARYKLKTKAINKISLGGDNNKRQKLLRYISAEEKLAAKEARKTFDSKFLEDRNSLGTMLYSHGTTRVSLRHGFRVELGLYDPQKEFCAVKIIFPNQQQERSYNTLIFIKNPNQAINLRRYFRRTQIELSGYINEKYDELFFVPNKLSITYDKRGLKHQADIEPTFEPIREVLASKKATAQNAPGKQPKVNLKAKPIKLSLKQRALPWVRRFVLYDNGTVFDKHSGLFWLQTPNIFNAHSWQGALDVAKNANIGGYSDWRIPNKEELHTFVGGTGIRSGGGGMANKMHFPGPFKNISFSQVWSSSQNSKFAYAINIKDGQIVSLDKQQSRIIWLVRDR